MAISLRRLDELLARYHVYAIQTVELPLDPATMHASAVESHADKSDGTVLHEVRKGYTRRDELLRVAEVVVNKRQESE
jgi:molecular chaperone GrpE (heat shock protein)